MEKDEFLTKLLSQSKHLSLLAVAEERASGSVTEKCCVGSMRIWVSTVVVIASYLSLVTAAKAQSIQYRVDIISADGTAVLIRFSEAGQESLRLEGLELASDVLGKRDPLQTVWTDSKPNLAVELLNRGLAKNSSYSSAPPELRAAEDQAKREYRGMWADLKPVPVVPQQETRPTSVPQSPGPDITESKWTTTIGSLLLGFIGLGGFLEIANFLRSWIASGRVRVLMIGSKSSGKSWIWWRLKNPDCTRQELDAIGRSTGPREDLFPDITWGKISLQCRCVDIAGHTPWEFIKQARLTRGMFNHVARFVFPPRHVWIIVCSTSGKVGVNRQSPESDRIDPLFCEKQLGFADLPRAFLASGECEIPKLIVVAISKIDLLTDHAAEERPDDPNHQAQVQYLGDRFREHALLIEGAANESGHKVPIKVIFLSPLQGWGFRTLDAQIKGALR